MGETISRGSAFVGEFRSAKDKHLDDLEDELLRAADGYCSDGDSELMFRARRAIKHLREEILELTVYADTA